VVNMAIMLIFKEKDVRKLEDTVSPCKLAA
jgi:hypothetical protein